MKRILVAWLMVLGMVLPAWAIEPVGSAASVFGKVNLVRNGKSYVLTQGLKLYNGDAVVAGNDAFAKLLLNDDSLLTVGENSNFKVEGFKQEPTARFGNFRLMFGKVRAIVSKFGAGKTDYKFVTPTAVAGVRGTHLVLEFDQASQQTVVSVVEGSVGFKANNTPAGEVVVGAQQRSEQKGEAPAGQPQRMSQEQIKQLDTEISQQTPKTEDEGTQGGDKGTKPAAAGSGAGDGKGESNEAAPEDAPPGDPESRLEQNIERVDQVQDNTTAPNQQETNPAANPASQTGVRVRW
jgi:hypothetical protein